MAKAKKGTRSTSVPLGPWVHYKRMVDNVTVSARLIKRDKVKLLEVKEPKMSDFCCPNCKYMLTQRDTGSFPNFFLEPKLFHANHRPALDFTK